MFKKYKVVQYIYIYTQWQATEILQYKYLKHSTSVNILTAVSLPCFFLFVVVMMSAQQKNCSHYKVLNYRTLSCISKIQS